MNNEVVVLIPCFNEELTIGKVIRGLKKELPKAKIYVYDNNSTDKTVKVAKENGAIVKYEYKQGKGNVVRRMFREIKADCYLMIDGDNTYSVKYAKKMCDYVLNKQVDMVIGDRLSSNYFKENKRLFHNFGNKLVRRIINILFKSNIHDIMTGYRAFSYNFVKTFPIISKGFEIETEMTIHALDKNMLIEEVPIEYKDRECGSISKLHTFKDGYKVLKMILNLFIEYRPLTFFMFLSFIFLIIALSFGIPVFIEYFKTGLVPRFPTLIFSGFMLTLSMLLLMCGIILNIVIKKDRKLFEYILINNKR